MASTSDRGIELNRSDRGWEAETSNYNEPLSRSTEKVQVSNAVPTREMEIVEPIVGMEFKSVESARMFYETYGRRNGFTIRNGHIRRSQKDKSIIGREFVCSKEGHRVRNNPEREKKGLPPRRVSGERCNARMRVAQKEGTRWVIMGFVKEHSHALNPSRIPITGFQMDDEPSDEIDIGEGDKDKRIRSLLRELSHERKLHAACRQQLNMTLKYIEEHNQNLSLKIESIVNKVKEVESKDY